MDFLAILRPDDHIFHNPGLSERLEKFSKPATKYQAIFGKGGCDVETGLLCRLKRNGRFPYCLAVGRHTKVDASGVTIRLGQSMSIMV